MTLVFKILRSFPHKTFFVVFLCSAVDQETGQCMQWLIEIMLENEVEWTSNLHHRIYYFYHYKSIVSDVMKLELIVVFFLTSESFKSVRLLYTQC